MAVESDQVIGGVTAGHALGKQFAQGRALRHVDLVGESAAVIVQEKDFHWGYSF